MKIISTLLGSIPPVVIKTGSVLLVLIVLTVLLIPIGAWCSKSPNKTEDRVKFVLAYIVLGVISFIFIRTIFTKF